VILVRLGCDKSSPMNGSAFACQPLDVEIDPRRALETQITERRVAEGWTIHGDKHYCPRHNPANVGLPLVLTGDYIEPLPGVRLRLVPRAISGGGAEVRAELLLDKDRYDVEEPSPGVWRAKPVGTRWPVHIDCERCHDRGYIPDFSQGLDAVYGEPGKKPCPDCQSEQTGPTP